MKTIRDHRFLANAFFFKNRNIIEAIMDGIIMVIIINNILNKY